MDVDGSLYLMDVFYNVYDYVFFYNIMLMIMFSLPGGSSHLPGSWL